MAFTDLTQLQNIDPINLSFQNLSTPLGAITQIKDTATNELGNFWFISAILLLFMMLIWWFYREDKRFAYDITRSIMLSSSWCFFLSTAFILSSWVNTILPLIWFGTIFTISVVAIMKLKEKNL